ncbi:MAG: hypothetical protein NTY07_19120 [Bacteroidia bacterium]|nr:hypothetical protein [Bacteroidia bacterium]
MRQIYRSLSLWLLVAGISVEYAVAQKDTTKLNQSVEVVKAYSPSISNANKVNLLPVIDDTTRFTPEFKYSIDSKPVKTGFTASPIGAADVKGLPSKDLGLGYLKLGAGTYSTLYGEFFLNVPKSQVGTFGLHLRHLSTDGKTNLSEGDLVDAPYSQNNGELFGSVNLGSTILSGELSYNRDAMRYYGYPVALPANISQFPSFYGLRQAYQNGDFKVSLKNSEKSKSDLNFNGGLRLGFFDAKTGQKETSESLFGKFDYNFGQVYGILDLSFDHLSTDSIYIENPSGIGTKTEDWIRIAPSVRLDGDNWSLRGGINFVGLSDKNDANTTRIYPDFEFNFKPVDDVLTLYAGFKGDLKNNRYSDIANENYWTDPRHNVRNTDYTYIISGGLKGKISREISYNVGLKYSQVKDLYFYVLNGFSSGSSTAPAFYNNAFDLTYDNAGIFNLSTEFSYVSGKDLSVVLKGNYYNYKLESLSFAPQKPNFDFTTSAGFRIIDRLTGFADFEVIGERKALVYLFDNLSSSLPVTQTKVFSIDPLIRINLGATYDLTNKFKLFGRVDNLLNMQNEQWLGYTSQGLRLMAGATFSF